MRITGFSGMDTEQMIKDLMSAERIPLDKLTQKKTTYEWSRDKYREMNSLLRDLDSLIFDTVGKQGNFLSQKITTSNENAVSVKGSGSTDATNVSISVTQLATASSWSGTAAQVLKGEKIGATDGEKITINGKEIVLSKDDTMESLAKKITNSDAGVNAIYDEEANRLVFSSKETGAGARLNISFENKTLQNKLGLGSQQVKQESVGQNAVFTYNGVEFTRSSNNFTLNGLEFTLKEVTKAPVTISSTLDVDKAVETVTKFVGKYNEILEKINGVIGEKKYRDFPPLTDEQKEGMSDKQIELWEEKAKSGLLSNDSILSSGLASMRNILYTKVEGGGAYDMLTKIGITTSSNYAEKGKLVIDETKLREALTKEPEAVYNLFNSEGTKDAAGKVTGQGLAKQLRASIKNTMASIESRGGSGNSSFMSKQIEETNKRISNMQRRLADVEARYYKEFGAMESALAQMQNQSMSIMGMFPS